MTSGPTRPTSSGQQQSRAPQVLGAAVRVLQWDEETALHDWRPRSLEPRRDQEDFASSARLCASLDEGHEVVVRGARTTKATEVRLCQAVALWLPVEDLHAPTWQLAWQKVERLAVIEEGALSWDAIESWSHALKRQEIQLACVPNGGDARARGRDEALRLERLAIRHALMDFSGAIVVRGPLALRRGAWAQAASRPPPLVVALCEDGLLLPPLIEPEWPPGASEASIATATPRPDADAEPVPAEVQRVADSLEAGQRSPVWACQDQALGLAVWLMRLGAVTVRVEVPLELWREQDSPARREAFVQSVSQLGIAARNVRDVEMSRAAPESPQVLGARVERAWRESQASL